MYPPKVFSDYSRRSNFRLFSFIVIFVLVFIQFVMLNFRFYLGFKLKIIIFSIIVFVNENTIIFIFI